MQILNYHLSPVTCTLSEKRSFTLVEIMIVVAIIGTLAGLGVPGFMRMRQDMAYRNHVYKVATFLQKARRLAISDSNVYLVNVDLNNKELVLLKAGQKKNEESVQILKLLKGVRLDTVNKSIYAFKDGRIIADDVKKPLKLVFSKNERKSFTIRSKGTYGAIIVE